MKLKEEIFLIAHQVYRGGVIGEAQPIIVNGVPAKTLHRPNLVTYGAIMRLKAVKSDHNIVPKTPSEDG